MVHFSPGYARIDSMGPLGLWVPHIREFGPVLRAPTHDILLAMTCELAQRSDFDNARPGQSLPSPPDISLCTCQGVYTHRFRISVEFFMTLNSYL
jgi:hypothetical protein